MTKQVWEPFNIIDADIMATDIKDRDIEPIKVLVTVVGGLLTMRMSDSDTPFLSWQLKDHIRLCRLATHTQSFDAPNSVGWWWFDGISTATNKVMRESFCLSWENGELVISSELGGCKIDHLIGKWYGPVVPPWNTPAPPTQA